MNTKIDRKMGSFCLKFKQDYVKIAFVDFTECLATNLQNHLPNFTQDFFFLGGGFT
jgi:hypothetical protein